MMKILHVSYFDLSGGAARAAYRIHCALRRAHLDSRMAVIRKSGDDPNVIRPLGKFGMAAVWGCQRFVDAMAKLQRDPNATMRSFNFFSSGLAARINRSDVDLVNLHWIGQEALSIAEVAAIQKPIVWTMHDMWPFSGAEHYENPEGPPRWRSGYRGDRAATAIGPDLDAWSFARKKRLWRNRTFHLVSPSRWLADCAGASALFGRMPCRVIPNCVDLSVYKPFDRRIARERLNLDPNKKYVLFGAASSTSDPRKGFRFLQDILHRLAADDAGQNVELLVFGGQPPPNPPDFGLPAHYLGSFSDELALSLVYAAADVFAAPSMQDNLPNTLVEAMAAGTPAVAFAIGGMSDLIEPDKTGFLVPAFDVDAFAGGLSRILSDECGRFGRDARAKAEAQYSEAVVAEQYRSYYQEVLSK